MFASSVTGGVLRTSSAHPEVRYVPRSEIAELGRAHLLRGTHIELAVDDHARGQRLPIETIRVVDASPLPG